MFLCWVYSSSTDILLPAICFLMWARRISLTLWFIIMYTYEQNKKKNKENNKDGKHRVMNIYTLSKMDLKINGLKSPM